MESNLLWSKSTDLHRSVQNIVWPNSWPFQVKTCNQLLHFLRNHPQMVLLLEGKVVFTSYWPNILQSLPHHVLTAINIRYWWELVIALLRRHRRGKLTTWCTLARIRSSWVRAGCKNGFHKIAFLVAWEYKKYGHSWCCLWNYDSNLSLGSWCLLNAEHLFLTLSAQARFSLYPNQHY